VDPPRRIASGGFHATELVDRRHDTSWRGDESFVLAEKHVGVLGEAEIEKEAVPRPPEQSGRIVRVHAGLVALLHDRPNRIGNQLGSPVGRIVRQKQSEVSLGVVFAEIDDIRYGDALEAAKHPYRARVRQFGE